MHVTLKTLWLATYRVFSARLVLAGCSMTLREVMEDWKNTGLRKTDLATALESLQREGYIRLESTPAGRVVRLVNEEFGLLRPGNKEDQEAAKTLVQIRELRRRPQGHLGSLSGRPAVGRRKSDPSASAGGQPCPAQPPAASTSRGGVDSVLRSDSQPRPATSAQPLKVPAAHNKGLKR